MRRVKDWVERTAGAMIPARYWGKLFRLALRKAHRRGDQFLTFHERPKFAHNVGLWSDARPSLPTVAVVLQGPLQLTDDFTVETVRLYRQTFARCPLIVSTWAGEDASAVARLRDAGAEVLLNTPPAFAGFKNTNYQLVSALAGIRRARELGAAYTLKTRTDQRMYAPNIPAFLVGLVEAFPPAPGTAQRRRVVSTSLWSPKYSMYQVSDMTVFGDTADLETYFGVPHTITVGLPPDFRNNLGEVSRINPPEQHIVTGYLRTLGRPYEWTLAGYWQALADHFAIVDRSALDLIWRKLTPYDEHPRPRYAGIEALHELTFAEWLNIRAGLANKADWPRHEASQALHGGQYLPGAAPAPPPAQSPRWDRVRRFAQRASTRTGGTYVTAHARPRSAAGVGTWADPLTVPPDVAIVVQGPIITGDQFTLETVRLYRRHFTGHPIIVSTWDTEPPTLVAELRATGVEVVLSPQPADRGPLNVNLQVVGTRAGIDRARQLGAAYVLKTRTDQRIYVPGAAEFLANLLKVFPVRSGFRQRGRIVSCGRSSFKFGLYHVSDQLLFGHLDDLATYFSPPPRPSELPAGYRDVIGEICRYKSPESYLASRFLETVGRPVTWTLADSWDAIVGHFCVIDGASLDVYWPKYAPHVEHVGGYGPLTSSQVLDFREWLALCHSRPDPGLYEAALGLPLHAPLPQLTGQG